MQGNAYDQVSYSHLPTAETHPDRLAVLARLRALNPPPVDRARVLDLGANEGGCLIPMALSLPGSEFVGVELAEGPVERGNRIIRELGISNARLLSMDLMDIDPSFGEFDYVIAHGLYAWTPEAVRDKVLAITKANLSPNGVALISYNTYPGGHIRQMLREMMLLHAAGTADPAARIRQARAILELMANANTAANGIAQAIAQEAKRTLLRRDASIFHDYMSDEYRPVHFRDFIEHAARHGLTYLDEASVVDARNVPLTPQTQESVGQFAAGDRILKEQYFDLLRVRHFRSSLVCHASTAPAPEWIDERVEGLFAASPIREISPGRFASPGGVTMETANPSVIEFLRRCRDRWPQAVTIAQHETELAVALFEGGLIEIRSVPGAAKRAGEQPLASPLARYQAREGAAVASLLHTAVDIPDVAARKFLGMLDGSRDRQTLAEETGCTHIQVDQELDRAADLGLLLG